MTEQWLSVGQVGETGLPVRYSGLTAGLALAAVSFPAAAQLTAEEALARSRVLPSLDRCRPDRAGDEIIVCGRRGGDDRYRLPRTGEVDPADRHRRVPGEIARASAEPLSFAPCGIFAGQRRCGKQEMLDYGYGGGRDPLTVAGKLFTALTDPDAAAGPPPLPKAPRSP